MSRNALHLACSACLALVATAAAAGTGFYVGGSWGRSGFHHDVQDFDFDAGVVAASGRVDGADSGWKLFAGYELGNRFALEAGHTVLNNDYDGRTTFSTRIFGGSGDPPTVSVSVDLHRPSATFLAGVGRFRLGPRATLYGKLGAHAWDVRITTIGPDGRLDERRDGIAPFAGLGLSYSFARRWAVRLDYERFANIADDDIDLLSTGLTYSFGRRRPRSASARAALPQPARAVQAAR